MQDPEIDLLRFTGGGEGGDYPSRSPAYVRLLEFVSWGHFPSVKALAI